MSEPSESSSQQVCLTSSTSEFIRNHGSSVPSLPVQSLPVSSPGRYSIWHVYASAVTGKSLAEVIRDESEATRARKSLWPAINVHNLKTRCLLIVKNALRGLNVLYKFTSLSTHAVACCSFPLALRIKATFPLLSASSPQIGHEHIQRTFLCSRLEVLSILAIMSKLHDDHIAFVIAFHRVNCDALASLPENPFDEWPRLLQVAAPEEGDQRVSSPLLDDSIVEDDDNDGQTDDALDEGDDSTDSTKAISGSLGNNPSLAERAAFFREMYREAMSFKWIQCLQGLTCIGSADLPVITGYIPHNKTGHEHSTPANITGTLLKRIIAETGIPYVVRRSQKTIVTSSSAPEIQSELLAPTSDDTSPFGSQPAGSSILATREVGEFEGISGACQCKFGPNSHHLLPDDRKVRKGANSKKQGCPSSLMWVTTVDGTFIFWLPRHSHSTDAVHLLGVDLAPIILEFLTEQLPLHHSVESLRHVLNCQKMIWRQQPDHEIHTWDDTERYNPSDQKLANMLNAKEKHFQHHSNDCLSTESVLAEHLQKHPKDKYLFIPPSAQNNNTFMLVYQSGFHRFNLHTYGRVAFGVDGTYKTLKYGFAMYFIVVVDNSKMAQIAALFIIPREDNETIAAALQVIREWNPDWRPNFAMIDKSAAEISALEKVFNYPEFIYILCEFHRLQSLQRKLNSLGITGNNRKRIYTLFRQMGQAWQEAYYLELKGKLQHEYLDSNQALSEYFESCWFNCELHWTISKRHANFNALNTNNACERTNRTVKQTLRLFRDNRMDTVMRALLNIVFPKFQQRYETQNLLSWRQYVKSRDPFMHITIKVRKRLEIVKQAASSFDPARIIAIENGKAFIVKSGKACLVEAALKRCRVDELTFDDTLYVLNLQNLACTCPAAVIDVLPCKHAFIIIQHSTQNIAWSASMFPLIQIDEAVIQRLDHQASSRYRYMPPLPAHSSFVASAPESNLTNSVASAQEVSSHAHAQAHRNRVDHDCLEMLRLMKEISDDIYAIQAANAKKSGKDVSVTSIAEAYAQLCKIRDTVQTVRQAVQPKFALPPPRIGNKENQQKYARMPDAVPALESQTHLEAVRQNHMAYSTAHSKTVIAQDFHRAAKRPKKARQGQDRLFAWEEISEFQVDIVQEHALLVARQRLQQSPNPAGPSSLGTHMPPSVITSAQRSPTQLSDTSCQQLHLQITPDMSTHPLPLPQQRHQHQDHQQANPTNTTNTKPHHQQQPTEAFECTNQAGMLSRVD